MESLACFQLTARLSGYGGGVAWGRYNRLGAGWILGAPRGRGARSPLRAFVIGRSTATEPVAINGLAEGGEDRLQGRRVAGRRAESAPEPRVRRRARRERRGRGPARGPAAPAPPAPPAGRGEIGRHPAAPRFDHGVHGRCRPGECCRAARAALRPWWPGSGGAGRAGWNSGTGCGKRPSRHP